MGPSQRIAVVDLGSNSTRLLVSDVSDGRATPRERRSEVTRLGDGVDSSGRLGDEAMERVFGVVAGYRVLMDEIGDVDRVVGVATSAVRDSENGDDFRRALADRYGVEVQTIAGEEEARLTFLGATARREHGEPALVIDIGGGSTEYVVGAAGEEPSFRVSTRLGSVRQTERHLHSDPPSPAELQALRDEARAILAAEIPEAVRSQVSVGIAVAGTATQLAAIDLGLEPYDPDRVDGHRLSREACEALLAPTRRGAARGAQADRRARPRARADDRRGGRDPARVDGRVRARRGRGERGGPAARRGPQHRGGRLRG